ncbi:ABC transporter membrane-spanning permease-phosphate transport [[Clostridium] ultunense Esp]|uniref:Phosphate transport system permease protein PstA n=1 Tax=[Clostridium] ultunense Esp TaxID=1288971 RepID=M1Z642_9FIRM|nr:phosphate ABC transporter permease PstA [Schnuerera ultunensis]CCQ98270.1 ABC transporter membrane-spanning permease-phosphate transport [[Clostridium] ultunense Esp]SHD76020.1 ABC transporter membrane-spanning permease-phosphate transport [[Clostridium] ultunense Esp]
MDRAIKTTIKISAFITFGVLFFIIGYILIMGLPNLDLSLFQLKYTTENVSLFPAMITTLMLIFLTLVIATPIGIFTGFYLVEYAKKGNKRVEIIRIATETLSGIPSIVYGLFGMLFFVIRLNFKYSLLAGALTAAIMVLPLIIRTTEEALLSVDDSLREASFALGAGKLRTIFKVVLSVAMPGILSGIILSIGRIVGETAALIFTLGTATKIPEGLFSSGRTLALHMYVLSTEGLHVKESYATGVILLIVILVVNGLSTLLSNKLTKGNENE